MADEIIFADGKQPGENISPIETWYEDEKGRMQFHAQKVFLSDSPSTAIPDCPDPYPAMPQAWIRKVVARGRGVDNAQVVVVADYDTKGMVRGESSAIDEAMSPQQFWISAPIACKLRWANKKYVTDAMAYNLLGWAYELKYTGLLSAPAISLSQLGCCSGGGTACTVLPYSFPAEHVLFGAPAVSAHAEMGKGRRFSAIFRHLISPVGWNKWWHAENGAWEYLYTDKKATTRYIQYPPAWM